MVFAHEVEGLWGMPASDWLRLGWRLWAQLGNPTISIYKEKTPRSHNQHGHLWLAVTAESSRN